MEASNESTVETESVGEQEAEAGSKRENWKGGNYSQSDSLDPSIPHWSESLLFGERFSAFQECKRRGCWIVFKSERQMKIPLIKHLHCHCHCQCPFRAPIAVADASLSHNKIKEQKNLLLTAGLLKKMLLWGARTADVACLAEVNRRWEDIESTKDAPRILDWRPAAAALPTPLLDPRAAEASEWKRWCDASVGQGAMRGRAASILNILIDYFFRWLMNHYSWLMNNLIYQMFPLSRSNLIKHLEFKNENYYFFFIF